MKDFNVSDDLYSCISGKLKKSACHKVAVDFSESKPYRALEILNKNCAEEFIESCKFLAKSYYMGNNLENAFEMYKVACLSGDSQSCTFKEQIQKEIVAAEDKEYRKKHIKLVERQVASQEEMVRETRFSNFLNAQRNIQLQQGVNQMQRIGDGVEKGVKQQKNHNRWIRHGY
jgi:hypothetical protein